MNPPRPLVWEDIMHLPEHEMPELIDGKPYVRAAPRRRHGFVHACITAALHRPYNTAGSGWWIVLEPDGRLSPSARVKCISLPALFLSQNPPIYHHKTSGTRRL